MSRKSNAEELMLKLRNLGLTPYEAKAYLVLLRNKVMTSTQISKEAHIPQPRVYDVLKSLEDKGLVIVSEGRPKLYRVEEPRKALKKLAYRIIEKVKENYLSLVDVLEEMYVSKAEEVREEIWKLNSPNRIYDKILDVISNAQVELLISAYDHMLDKLKPRLKKLNRKGVSICLITYSYSEPQKYVDEHRVKKTIGTVIVIADRSEMVFVTNWHEPLRVVPTGFYTKNIHLIRLFNEYFIHNLRDFAEPIYTSWGKKVFTRKFLNLVRAIDMINILRRSGRKVTVKVSGRYVKTGKKVFLEGEPVRTVYNVAEGVAQIFVRTPDGREVSVGGWQAYLEDVEAEYVEVIS